ncbi:putative monovalent cation/H+ antiporter subunit D [delta proteobacterium NaphS2]|nr:putative monovalent cation/H+ antiporter subunit D [delta proteobacterium NaphS2]
MTDAVPPVVIFMVGALVLPIIPGRLKSAWLLFIPVIGFINLLYLGEGTHFKFDFLEYQLVLGRVDKLSLIFAYIFHLISFIAILYALHVKDNLQQMAGLMYAGSALGAIFAGDLFTFFVFWEMLTVTSIFLIWSRRTKAALSAGFRYVLVHAAGGLCLLAGIVIHVSQTGSMQFDYLGLNGPGSYFIFLGFGLNCAWPLLHPWLTDSYPEATITGTVFLSAFTTKVAVYALARGFPGTEILIWIGAVMTGFPIFYAVIENDLRRVLAYSLVNQVGFMVCGIGIGTALAINGAVCHAFNDILFKGLLFMSMGAVMYRTGKINGTDLGGLYRTMPLTCIFCMVGAASISAFPLFSGFVSKSMVMDAAASGHMRIVWFILLFASAGVFHHAGIKIPYFAFFSHDSGMRPKEAPIHMLLAMGIAAGLCIFIGVYPAPLYSLLPYPVDYAPYTAPHVVGQTQLLFFSALAFTLLLRAGIYPAEIRCINLDADWFYRKGGKVLYHFFDLFLNGLNRICERVFVKGIAGSLAVLFKDITARLTLIMMVSIWILMGVRGERLKMKKTSLYADMMGGTVPIGIGAGASTLFLLLIFIFT